ARTVRTDDAAELADVDVQREVVERAKPVEAHRDVFDVQDRPVRRIARHRAVTAGARTEHLLPALFDDLRGVHAGTALGEAGAEGGLAPNRSNNPTTPRGRNSVTTTNSRPSAYSQNSGSAAVKN